MLFPTIDGEIVGSAGNGMPLVQLEDGKVVPAVWRLSHRLKRRIFCIVTSDWFIGRKVKVVLPEPPKPARIVDITMR